MTLLQRLKRIRCWLRTYHIVDARGLGKFTVGADGMCWDCGKVGTGEFEDWDVQKIHSNAEQSVKDV